MTDAYTVRARGEGLQKDYRVVGNMSTFNCDNPTEAKWLAHVLNNCPESVLDGALDACLA